MFETPFQATGQPEGRYCDGRCHHRRSGPVRTVLFWAAVAVVAMMALGAATWAFGLMFHLVALLVRIAVVTAVVAFVWRRVSRHRQRNPGL